VVPGAARSSAAATSAALSGESPAWFSILVQYTGSVYWFSILVQYTASAALSGDSPAFAFQ